MTSIRRRLLAGLLIPLVAVAALMSLETFFAARHISKDLNDRTLLAASLTILEHVIATDGTVLAGSTLDTLTENLGDRFFYHVIGPGGAFVTGYSGYPRLPADENPESTEPIYFDAVHLGQKVRVVRLRRDLSDRELNGVTTITTWQRIQLRQSLTLDLFMRSLARLTLLVLAAGLIVWFAVTRGLKPLINLQEAIELRSPVDLAPIRRAMPSELSEIVSSMNTLFERVARSKSNRERFIGDAAHQLKNPIAAIKVQAQTALEQKDDEKIQNHLQQIVSVADQSASMVNKMLSGASAYAMDKTSFIKTDLASLMQAVVSDAANAAFARGLDISVSGLDYPHWFRGDATLLREGIANLLDNAIRYAPNDSTIHVALETRPSLYRIVVQDAGPAFAEDTFQKLTQPFVSGEQINAGSGLGLSIIKDIAKAHGGMLLAEALDAGKQLVIELPRAQDASA